MLKNRFALTALLVIVSLCFAQCMRNNDYIIVDVDCTSDIRDCTRPCESVVGSSGAKRTIIKSGTSEYIELYRLYGLFKPDTNISRALDAEICIKTFKNDVLINTIAIDFTKHCNVDGRTYLQLNDSLVRYIYHNFCK